MGVGDKIPNAAEDAAGTRPSSRITPRDGWGMSGVEGSVAPWPDDGRPQTMCTNL